MFYSDISDLQEGPAARQIEGRYAIHTPCFQIRQEATNVHRSQFRKTNAVSLACEIGDDDVYDDFGGYKKARPPSGGRASGAS